ncbi:hypothetical protein NMY22_g17539 [Coprinellus aureogranulatus]|nr:hypothetical protein NMY22_g17539 [Coprinellus aureogranulatus]
MSNLDLKAEHKQRFLDFYTHLPDEFYPMELMQGPPEIPKEEWTRQAWEVYLCKTFPRSHIPSRLTLKSGFSFQPPRFLFGWAMEPSVLVAIAERCGFAEDARLGQTLQATSVLTGLIRKKYPQVTDALGWVVVHSVMNYEGDKYKRLKCIALADSWITGNRKPAPEHVETLREFLGIGSGGFQTATLDNGPMWWVDLIVPQWHYRHKRDDLRDYRPWDLEKRVAR